MYPHKMWVTFVDMLISSVDKMFVKAFSPVYI